MGNSARRYATSVQGTRSGAVSAALARAHQWWLEVSMPSYAICGIVEAKPLNVQRSNGKVHKQTGHSKRFFRVQYKLFWSSQETTHGSIILLMIAR
jgi:hypothetical protein